MTDIITRNTLFDMDEVPVVSGKSNEWYTPSQYIEAAREVMQSIDLDPASCELANRNVKAEKYYTKEGNGLEQPWYGNIWLNPPYKKDNSQPPGKKSTIAMWVSTLIERYEQGSINQAILLVTTQVDSSWFLPLWNYPICFADHTVYFYRPTLLGSAVKDGNGHFFGTAFVYLGPHIQTFAERFSEFGPVVLPSGVYRRPAPAIQPTLWEGEHA